MSGLTMPAGSLVAQFVLGHLVEDVVQQVVVVLLVRDVLLERPCHLLGDGELLRLDKTADNHADGHVDVVVPHIVAQMQLQHTHS